MFYFSMRGNVELNLGEVLLNVYLIKQRPIGAEGVSIKLDDVRYDFVSQATNETIGGYTCEHFTLPLDQKHMSIIPQIVATDSIAVRIYGNAGTYETIMSSATSSSKKYNFESACIAAAKFFQNEIEAISYEHYTLFDLNAGYWLSNRPISTIVDISPITTPFAEELVIDSTFYMLDLNNITTIRELQRLLSEQSFYYGKQKDKYTEEIRESVKEAQQYYGLLATGQPDFQLLYYLSEKKKFVQNSLPRLKDMVEINNDNNIFGELGICYTANDVCQVQFNRYWHAQAISALNSENIDQDNGKRNSPNSVIVPKDKTNSFIIIDGTLTNLMEKALFLPLNISATIVYSDRYLYHCVVRCEVQDQTAFGVELLPLGSSRIVCYAEVPNACLQFTSFDFSFVLSSFNSKTQITYNVK